MTPDLPTIESGESDGLAALLPGALQALGRRRALQLLGGAALAGVVAACSSSSSTSAPLESPSPSGSATAPGTATSAATTATTSATAASAGSEIPDETQGPFPADGSNGPDVLAEEGVVREDLTASFGPATGTADGVPLAFRLTIVDAATGGPLAGAAVYAWHCTADGRYSVYEVTDQNYLRGVQVADDAGRLTFASIFPGCYPGRWPHVHFAVYPTLDAATAGSQAMKTSQLALPEADCRAVYGDARYTGSAANLDRLSLATDLVFADGWSDQLATVDGSADDGYEASLLVRV
jgi:protocatechuate 3,4-dioxygenase beta subunit